MLLLMICAMVLQSAFIPASPDETYRDADLHFSFTYPSILVNIATQSALNRLTNEQTDAETKQTISCTTIPLAAIHKEGKQFDEVMILRLNLDCSHQTITVRGLPDFTRALVSQTLSKRGTADIHGQFPTKIAGYSSFIVQASVDERTKTSAGILLSTSICSFVDHSIVCWQVLSFNESKERELLSHPVTFVGHAPEPLYMPASLTH